MADDRPAGEVASSARCPWCSAPLDATDAATCPSCGATLSAESEPQLPGVTTIAPSSMSRSAQRRPNRIVQWITGESGEAPAPPPAAPAPGSLTPPAADVRMEMLRLEIAARLADRTAEIEALEAEARLEAGPDAAPAGGGDRAAAAATEPAGEPTGAATRASTWAELDEASGAEPASGHGAPAASSQESTPDDPASGPFGQGTETPPESPEPHT